MDKKFIKRREKSIGFKKIKTQITTINMLTVFFVFGGAYAIYLNHHGAWLGYGILVAVIALLMMVGFISYRIRLQVLLSNKKVDYRESLVKPMAELNFEESYFLKKGTLTERDIISTNLFSDDPDYKYSACNELRGSYKGVRFSCSDIYEDCAPNNIHLYGRLYEFAIGSHVDGPVVFTSSSAPDLDSQNKKLHQIVPENEVIKRMFKVYAVDEKEVKNLLTENMIYKLRQIVSLQLGKILKIGFYSDKIYVYFTTDSYSFEDQFTKKHDVKTELNKIQNIFNVVGKLIDIL